MLIERADGITKAYDFSPKCKISYIIRYIHKENDEADMDKKYKVFLNNKQIWNFNRTLE